MGASSSTPAAVVLTVSEVAAMLCCSADTVRDWTRRGLLAGIKPGRDWVYPSAALADSLNALARAGAQRRGNPAEPAAVLQQPAPTDRHRRRAPPKLPTLPFKSSSVNEPRSN